MFKHSSRREMTVWFFNSFHNLKSQQERDKVIHIYKDLLEVLPAQRWNRVLTLKWRQEKPLHLLCHPFNTGFADSSHGPNCSADPAPSGDSRFHNGTFQTPLCSLLPPPAIAASLPASPQGATTFISAPLPTRAQQNPALSSKWVAFHPLETDPMPALNHSMLELLGVSPRHAQRTTKLEELTVTAQTQSGCPRLGRASPALCWSVTAVAAAQPLPS